MLQAWKVIRKKKQVTAGVTFKTFEGGITTGDYPLVALSSIHYWVDISGALLRT